MSRTAFHHRLERISGRQEQQHEALSRLKRRLGGGVNYARLAMGGALLWLGAEGAAFVNANYTQMRDDIGLATLGLALMAVLFVATGTVMLGQAALAALRARRPVDLTALPPPLEEAVPRASARAQTIATLVGLCLGAMACLTFAVTAAATQFHTETARNVELATALGVLVLALAAFLAGLLALFLPGRGLGRVLGYFPVGVLMMLLTLRFFRVTLWTWPQFVALMQ